MVSPNGVRRSCSWKGILVCITVIAFSPTARAVAQEAEIIVRNGLIVTVEGRMEADVRIMGETIAEIGPDLPSSAGASEIDARGMLLLPGAVDTHTHLNPEMPDPPHFRRRTRRVARYAIDIYSLARDHSIGADMPRCNC